MVKEILSGYMRLFVCMIVFMTFKAANAQKCTDCTTVITEATASVNITIGPSDVVCVPPGIIVTGNITLNGGVLCNQGAVSNLTLIEGKFLNSGTFSKPSGALNILNAKNLKIECYPGSSFDMSGSVNVSGLNANDSIVVNVYGGSKFSIGSNLSITKGWLKITNAIIDPLKKVPVTSVLNIGGQLDVSNAALKILNLQKGVFNVNKTITLDGKYNKIVNNYGSFNCNNAFNISGNGQGNYSTLINNYGSFNITGNLTSSYSNGTVTINNNNYELRPQPTFVVKKSITLSKDNNVFNNYRPLDVGLDITIEKGVFLNSSTVTARTIEVKQGLLTNNNQISAGGDFIITNVNGTVNNKGFINIAGEFNNIGTVNLGLTSYLKTTNYYNLNNGTINGPDVIPTEDDYAKVFISGTSQNTGYINGNVLFYDQTLVGTSNNNRYGFDLVNNASRISGNTAFAAISIGPGPPISINCALLQTIYTVLATSSPSSICSGGSATLTGQFSQKITFILFSTPITFYLPIALPNTSYTWTPGPLTGSVQTVSPLTTTTYTVKVNYLGCTFTKTTTVNVSNLTANAGPNVSICGGGSTTLAGFGTGGSFVYNWSWAPATGLSSTTIPNPVASPAVTTTYTLTITDTQGCVSTSTVKVTVSPALSVNAGGIVYTSASVPVMLGGTPTASGGTPAYSYVWTPSTGLSSTSSANPIATITSPATYTVTVTDSGSPMCSGTASVQVVFVNSNAYAILRKQLDGGYYQLSNGTIYFTIEGQYNNSAALTYKVYDANRTALPLTTPPTLPVVYGDNRYSIDLSANGFTAANNTKFYTLEVTNEKKEIFMVKFKYKQ